MSIKDCQDSYTIFIIQFQDLTKVHMDSEFRTLGFIYRSQLTQKNHLLPNRIRVSNLKLAKLLKEHQKEEQHPQHCKKRGSKKDMILKLKDLVSKSRIHQRLVEKESGSTLNSSTVSAPICRLCDLLTM